MTTYTQIESNEDIQWFILDGAFCLTGVCFDNDTYGLTEDGRLLDCDGCPMNPRDDEAIVVKRILFNIENNHPI